MLMPFMRAASKTLVPAGTRTERPSRVMSIIPGGVLAVVILRADPDALGFTGACRRWEANSAGAIAVQNMSVNLSAKMFQHGLNRRWHDLGEAAARGKARGV